MLARLAAVVVLIIGSVTLAVADPKVTQVMVEGNRRIESGTVLLQVSTKVGDTYSKALVSSDIKQIFRTGFFENVSAKSQPDGGGMAVIFVVQERPAIRNVYLEGNDEVKDDTLKEKLDLGVRRFLDRKKIRASLEQARIYYQGLGYYDAELSFKEALVEDNQVDLTIDVKEGGKVRIREIAFEGNKGLDTGELEDVIHTGTYHWWHSWITGSGTLKREEIDADSKELMKHYLNQGYVDIQIPEPEVTRIEDGLRVTYKINEGEIYNYGPITASGTLLNDDESETLKGIESKTGDVFNADALRKDTFLVSEKFTDKGYAFANVSPDTKIDRNAKIVAIEFKVDKGKEVHVDRINITGNKKTNDNVIRRNLQLAETELYSSSKIKRSQELLQRQGYFDEVSITQEPSAEEGKVDLNVGVREANTGSFSVGAGVSSGEGFLFQAQISENNIFGTGNNIGLDLNNGTRRDTYVLSFNNPRVDDTYLSFGADAQSTKRIYDDFDRTQAGGSLTFGYPLWFLGEEYKDDIRATLSYELMHIDISNIDEEAPQLIKDQKGSTIGSSITPKLTRNTINNPLDPTAGSRQIVGVEVAGLGGDQKFWLGQLSNVFYYNFWDSPIGPFVFSHRIRYDYGDTFNDEPFPLYRRFFPGGINSVRGYDWRDLGPKDENNREYGGGKELITNFELIFPIANSIGLKGVVFYDTGDAFDDKDSIEFSKLRQAVGWGIRWRSPIAPIRIEIGYPLDKEEGDKSMVTNFSFGSPF